MCKEAIVKLEDEQLELMEQSDAAQKVAANASQAAAERPESDRLASWRSGLSEENLRKELSALESNRTELAEAVEPGVRSKYDRLFNQRGGSVVVGIQNGVCAGCHMQLSRATVVECQAEQAIVTCTNCGGFFIIREDMNLAVAE